MNIEKIIEQIKNETNNNKYIVYRQKNIKNKKVYILFYDPLVSNNKVSDFIIRSLNKITSKNVLENIKNNLSSCKYKEITTYEEICKYLNNGFTIILIENEQTALAFETKGDIKRSVSTPTTENSIRGAKDAFIEDYQTNIGLIKKRIKSNNLWIKETEIGRYTKTPIGLVYINTIVKKELINKINDSLKEIDIDGIISAEELKNKIQNQMQTVFPTIETTERPDLVSAALLRGKIAIVVENSEFVLIIPGLFIDYFKAPEDWYGKPINVSITRLVKYIAFFISLLTPALYIALINYNQEIIPTDLLISFSTQREGVPFPAFIEAFIMMIAFEIIKESEYRIPSSGGSALSIVGALILGDAAVSAGIVSPIMIIVIAVTAISSLPFTEPEFINTIRTYRILFLLGASLMGIVGTLGIFLFLITKLASIKTYGIPYLSPLIPTDTEGIKNSIIKLPNIKKRMKILSNNTIKDNPK